VAIAVTYKGLPRYQNQLLMEMILDPVRFSDRV